MTVRWQVRVSHTRERYQVRLARLECDHCTYVVLGTHDSRHDAERHRALVRVDPAAHWREPVKRGPKARAVTWYTELRDMAGGRVAVSLVRSERGRRRAIQVRTLDTRDAAVAFRELVRVDPAAYWREPDRQHPAAIAARSRARDGVRVQRVAPETAAELQSDGRWLLGCGIHTAPSARPCPVCAKAAAETDAALDRALTDRMAVMKRRAA